MNPVAGETKNHPRKGKNSSVRTDGKGSTSLNIQTVL
jgi:hypothetical protein